MQWINSNVSFNEGGNYDRLINKGGVILCVIFFFSVWVARLSNGYYKVIFAATTIASFYTESDLLYDTIGTFILDHLQM